MSKDVTIDKDVEVPDLTGVNARYPWREMEVGDSFSIPKDVKERSMHVMASRWGKKLDVTFSVSTKERRVWRTA